MARAIVKEPPYVDNTALYQWMLEVHKTIFGIGDDSAGSLDSDNITSSVLTVNNITEIAQRSHADLQNLDADDHEQYQKESEKDIAGGYCGLDSTAKIIMTQLPDEVAVDSDISDAIASHRSASDPHTGYLLAEGTNKITVSATAPVDPAVNDIWIDIS